MHFLRTALSRTYATGPSRWPALCLCILFCFSASISAQSLQKGGGSYTLPPGSMPPWTVPVLRLVSATHVEPTTGIVISDTGLVLVPEDFASIGDEIIVLDGGTDIIRNGRPARIERKFSTEGLQVLFVEGLSRSGATLAANTPAEGSEVLLTAFPPAEQIAEGKPPLSVPASIVVFNETGNPAISGETKLPNVTGGLIDSCGNLVGISMADDIQSMEHSPATRYQWRKGLLYILAEMQIAVREFDCSGQLELTVEEPPIEESEVESEEPPAEEVATPEEEPDADPATEQVSADEESVVVEQGEVLEDILPPIERDAIEVEAASDEEESSNWPWLIAALMLFGLGFILHRLRRASVAGPVGIEENKATPPPPTVQEEDAGPDVTPIQLDSELLIRGVLADGTEFESSCPVSQHAINVTIGRGDCDLVIESKAVSRRHVNLNGTWRELTVSDLGSSNGTSVNGVPCLEGEILFIETGDTLVLGNAQCTLEIQPQSASGKSP